MQHAAEPTECSVPWQHEDAHRACGGANDVAHSIGIALYDGPGVHLHSQAVICAAVAPRPGTRFAAVPISGFNSPAAVRLCRPCLLRADAFAGLSQLLAGPGS